MKELLKKYFSPGNKKRIVCSVICCVLFLGLYKWMPKSFSTKGTYMKYYVLADVILCLLMCVEIRISEKWNGYLTFFMLTVLPGVSLFFTESINGNLIRNMKFMVVALNYVLYLSVYLFVYFVSNRIRITVTVTSCFFTLYALVNSFVMEFRGNSIRMTDIFAVRTAMNVTSGYSFVMSPEKVNVILWTLAICFLAVHLQYREKKIKEKICQRVGIAGLWVCVFSLVFNKTFLEANELKPYIWELAASTRDHGVFLDLAAGIPYLSVEKPEGYSQKEADSIIEQGRDSSNSALKVENSLQGASPDIIVVMNESLSDLSRLGNLVTDGTYLDQFYAMKENVVRGEVSVPVFGGLTSNTEFEFLTGYSNAFFPSGVMAFQSYVKDETDNWNDYLTEKGYHSIFMHPMDRSGWNRDNVYSMFGFDEEYYIEDYVNNGFIRASVSDSSNYKEVIARYEEAKKENDQVFIFNVTMQNHGGYETNAIEKSVRVIQPEGSYPKTEEYLSLIKESDKAFQELVDYFSKRENPVMICMFGDHLPSVEEELIEKLLQDSDYSEVEKMAAKYRTPFMIYTNYEMEEKEFENLSTNYLQVLLSQAAGFPLNDYQKYLESLYEKYPVINEFGVKDAAGQWYTWEEASEFPDIKNYEKVQYRELFDK